MHASRIRSAIASLTASAVLTLSAAAPALAEKPGTVTTIRGAGPVVQAINGAPLTIRVGDEHSYQIINADIPGVGQIFPSSSSGTADMGWMVRTGGVLYAPAYSTHPSGSATGSLGAYTAYSGRTISAVTGTGTAADPFRVVVENQLGTSGLSSRETVRYVNGDNYFSKSFTLTNNSAASQDVSIFLGGDIYLAGDDSGVPYRQSASGSVGGSDCGTPASYYILYIPQTPANAWTGSGYGNVWSQIAGGTLSNTLSTTSCIDNGAALQWNRTIPAGGSTTVEALTSFGDIPSILLFDVVSVTPDNGAQGSTVNVTISGLGFAPGMQLNFGSGITLSNLVVVNDTTATATLTIAPSATVGPRDVVGTNDTATLTDTLVAGFRVTSSGGPLPGGPVRPVPAVDGSGLVLLVVGMLLVGLVAARRYS